jgi:hypothetical protein
MGSTVNLADDVYQAAKTLADGSGRSLGEVLTELVRRGLRPHGGVNLEEGLPLFAVSPDAEAILGSHSAEVFSGKDFE